MDFKTKFHGVREYVDEDIITFNKGLPGFTELKKFILFPVEENDMFKILHSIEDENIGIVVISPFVKFKDYEFKLSDEKLNELKINAPEDVMVLNTVTIQSKVEEITTNLRAPIIINIREGLGEQIILENDKYKIKQPLFKE